MRKITIYYGMSGTLKGTTIKEKSRLEGSHVFYTENKPWKHYENGIFSGLIEQNDLNYAILHFLNLRRFIYEESGSETPLIIERGITDYLYFYFSVGKERSLSDDLIKKCINEETRILGNYVQVERVLMIQNDLNFIKENVLSEPTRKRIWGDSVESYLKDQSGYVSFTKSYVPIDKTVEIKDARDYIENTLKLKYL